MPSITTITSYKPITGLVNRTGKNVTQHAKINRIALNMPKLREMVKGQNYVTMDDNSRISRIVCGRTQDGYCDDSAGGELPPACYDGYPFG